MENSDSVQGSRIPLHDAAGFAAMRRASQLAAAALDMITPYVLPGVTTGELDARIEAFTRDHKAVPAPLGYAPRGMPPFPKATCISPNHVVCHGIPGDKKLVNGDIINIDVTVILDGWYGDTSRMYLVGDKVPLRARKLVEVTYECLMRGIAAVQPGATLGDIGHAIQTHAEAHRFSVVRDFCGHGVGRVFHAAPTVMHFGRAGTGEQLKPGMIFTIEPMINAGRAEVKILDDQWTAVTKDRSLSAQFEHSIGVKDDGTAEIFTASPAGFTCPPYGA